MLLVGRSARRTLLQVQRQWLSMADPYYILGVDKATPYPQIKKAFYKLANEFHPDKNPSSEAEQKFVVIKQAFEAIKMEKGLMKPQHLYRSEDRASMRPNPEQYRTEDDENAKNFRDYTVFSEKASGQEEYETFNSSFRTIKDINEIKIKVEEGQMKDPTTRFGLDQFRGRISSYSEGGLKYIFVLLTGITFFTLITNQIFSQRETEVKEGALARLTQVHKRKTIQSDLIDTKKVDLANLEKSPRIREIESKLRREEVLTHSGTALLSDKVISPSQLNSV